MKDYFTIEEGTEVVANASLASLQQLQYQEKLERHIFTPVT